MVGGRMPGCPASTTSAAMTAASASSFSMDEGPMEDEESGSFMYGSSSSYASDEGRGVGADRGCRRGYSDVEDDEEEEDDDEMERPVELMDLPDHALANAFFSGFLDSIEVVKSLRVVNKRTMLVASDFCKVRARQGGTRYPSLAEILSRESLGYESVRMTPLPGYTFGAACVSVASWYDGMREIDGAGPAIWSRCPARPGQQLALDYNRDPSFASVVECWVEVSVQGEVGDSGVRGEDVGAEKWNRSVRALGLVRGRPSSPETVGDASLS